MNYPTLWQKKTMWAALSALSIVFIVVVAGATIWVGASIIGFLQPILIPVAIAAILAYLLDPLVTRICKGGLSRTKAVGFLFVIVFLALVALGTWLVPTISMQSTNFAKELPAYTQRARDRVVDLIVQYNRTFGPTGATRGKSASTTKRRTFSKNQSLSTRPMQRTPTIISLTCGPSTICISMKRRR